MTANTLLRKPRLVFAIAATVIVAVGAAGCSNKTSGTGTSSITSAPSSTAAPLSTSTASSSATASPRFVGHWQRHSSTMDITPTTATMFLGLGNEPCAQDPQAACSETDTLAVASGNDTQLTLTVTAVSYGLLNGQKTSNPTNATRTVVGDSIQLVWRAPGSLEDTVHGNWCGAGVSQSDAAGCGA